MDDLARQVDALLRSRRSTRAFTRAPVAEQQLREILETASSAPSNSNTQPWRVCAVTGAPMKALGEALVEAFRSDAAPPSPHFPEALPEALAARQGDFGARYYELLGIGRADTPLRAGQTQRNFSFFGAPVGLIFGIDRRLRAHSWLDLGLFVQSVMVAAGARGLATCPQVSFARFHTVIAEHLCMPEHEVTACGMSLGYADAAAAINGLRMPRERVDDFARFFGFEGAA